MCESQNCNNQTFNKTDILLKTEKNASILQINMEKYIKRVKMFYFTWCKI